MINFFQNIKDIFTEDRISLIKENVKEFFVEIKIEKGFVLSKEDLVKTLIINERDFLNVKLIVYDNTQAIYQSEINNVDEFINKIKEFSDENLIILNYIIYKEIKNSKITIYHLDKFYEYLTELKIMQFFSLLDKFISNDGLFFVCDEVIDKSKLLETETIKFLNSENITLNVVRNDKAIEKGKIVCYSNYSTKFKLVPDDFKIVKNSTNSNINEKFNLSSILLSIGFLFDITQLTNEKFSFKLNGYKTINYEHEIVSINVSSSTIYNQIYKWTYNGGNLNDKLGIVRNIVSLNLNEDLISIDNSTFDSIKSGYKIYEKDNLKQYIDIRNKISDQLWDFQAKADKISENFVSDLKKNIFALVSFFASVILLKVLSPKEQIIISDGTFLIMLGFLLVSYLILRYSQWEANEQKKRFINFYNNVKERYSDILDKNDIQRILNNDKEFIENKKFINEKIINYSKVWSIFIITFAIIIFLLNFFKL
jgi:hypothetical protein